MQVKCFVPSEQINKKIILFGTETWGKIVEWYLEKNSVTIYCYATINDDGTYKGKRVINLNELSELYSKEGICILMAVGKSMDIVYSELKNTCIDIVYSAETMIEEMEFAFEEFEDYIGQVYKDRKWYFWKLHQVFSDDKLSLYSLDVVLTERCTLRCRGCSNLMQYYSAPKNYDINKIIDQVDKILHIVDVIWELRLIGGEPFLNKQMYEIINKYSNNEKIREIVIYSNGTIIGDETCLSALRDGNVRIEFSDYGELSRNLDWWRSYCDKNEVKYMIRKYELWQDCGELKKRDYSYDTLKALYEECECRFIPTLLDGKIMACAYSAHAVNLEAMDKEERDKDVIEIYNLPSVEYIYKFLFGRDYLEACKYCNGRNYSKASIPAHIQTKEPLAYERKI